MRMIMFHLEYGAISYIHEDEISGYDDIRIFLLNFLKKNGKMEVSGDYVEAAVLEFPDSKDDHDDNYSWSMAEPDSPYLIFRNYNEIGADVWSEIVWGIEDIYNEYLKGEKNGSKSYK